MKTIVLDSKSAAEFLANRGPSLEEVMQETEQELREKITALTEEREALRVTLRFLARAAATEPSMSIYQGHIEHALKLVA